MTSRYLKYYRIKTKSLLFLQTLSLVLVPKNDDSKGQLIYYFVYELLSAYANYQLYIYRRTHVEFTDQLAGLPTLEHVLFRTTVFVDRLLYTFNIRFLKHYRFVLFAS